MKASALETQISRTNLCSKWDPKITLLKGFWKATSLSNSYSESHCSLTPKLFTSRRLNRDMNAIVVEFLLVPPLLICIRSCARLEVLWFHPTSGSIRVSFPLDVTSDGEKLRFCLLLSSLSFTFWFHPESAFVLLVGGILINSYFTDDNLPKTLESLDIAFPLFCVGSPVLLPIRL